MSATLRMPQQLLPTRGAPGEPAGVLTESIQTTRRVERRQYEPAAIREVRVQPSQEKPQGRQQQDDGLTVRYEYGVVDGPPGEPGAAVYP